MMGERRDHEVADRLACPQIIGEPDLRLEAGGDLSDVVKRGEYA